MIQLPDLVAGGLAAGTLSALALGAALTRSRRRQASQREQVGVLRARLDDVEEALTAEVAHLAAQRIPAAVRQSAHPHVTVPGPLRPQLPQRRSAPR